MKIAKLRREDREYDDPNKIDYAVFVSIYNRLSQTLCMEDLYFLSFPKDEEFV